MGHASDQWCITMVCGFPSPHINGVYSICNWYHPLSYPCRTMFITILSNSIQYYPRSFTIIYYYPVSSTGWLTVFSQQLGVFSHSKGLGAGRSSQNPDCQSSQVPRKRFPKIPKGSQEQVPKQGYQARRFPRKGFQARVPRTGCQARVFQAMFPRTGSQARAPSNVFQELFPKTGFQARFVPKDRFPRAGSQDKNEVTKQGFPSKAPRNRFANNVSRHRCPSKVFAVPDKWSIKGLSRFIKKHSSQLHHSFPNI